LSFDVTHDEKTLEKYPRPFFLSEDKRRIWTESGAAPDSSIPVPSVEITPEAVQFTAWCDATPRLTVDGKFRGEVSDWDVQKGEGCRALLLRLRSADAFVVAQSEVARSGHGSVCESGVRLQRMGIG
jgi:hypothetical protein